MILKLIALAVGVLLVLGGAWWLAAKKRRAAKPGTAPDTDSYTLALAHYDAGRRAEAEAAFRALLNAAPSHAEAWYKLGNLLKETGRAGEAEAAYRKAVAAKPAYPDAWLNLGNLLVEAGRLKEGEDAYRKALGVKSDFVEAYNNLGNLLQFSERMAEAEAAFRQALRIRPGFPEALNNLGILLIETERFAEAEPILREFLRVQPDDPEALSNLGILLNKSGRLDEAEAAFREALRIKPDYAEVYNNLAALLMETGQFDEAEALYRQALRSTPGDHEVQSNLAIALMSASRLDEAEHMLQQAQQAHPDNAMVLGNRGYLHLLRGDFEQGLAGYEYRWATMPKQHVPVFSKPRWGGEALAGKTLLIYCEQGAGDSLQFIRYLPKLAPMGGNVVLHCPAHLFRLFKANLPDSIKIVCDEKDLSDYDWYCPLLSLPHRFNTRLDTIPADIPYLQSPPDAIANGPTLPAKPGTRLKVGVVWAGNPAYKNDRNRSMAFSLLEPLLATPGVTWVILQKDNRPEGFDALVKQHGWCDPMGAVKDYADTAALVEQLDLVIGVDTSVIHLAGALGKPVWVMIPKAPDWRWMLDRDDSPWYPTLRLFRQQTRGDWPEVVWRVAEALASHVNTLSTRENQ